MQPPCDWAEFRRRSQERARAVSTRRTVSWQHAAGAAGLTAFIAAMAMFGRSQPATPVPQPVRAQSAVAAASAAATVARAVAIKQAQASQRWLARQPAEPVVVRVGPRLAVANLEDRIAWVDDVLTDEQIDGVDAEQVGELRHQRARLVNSLAQVRYAETLVAQAP
ncbi:MAG TPA: hypothetical protein VGO53_12335 [Steroidobacteraceae bacterium]|nr:hypothetical protein [Steroidobacteraceae bacterium]